MDKTCKNCMYLDKKSAKTVQDTLLGIPCGTKQVFWCKGFGVWREKNTPACTAYVNDPTTCYLTTACVAYKGLPDDCEELTLLRFFRDTYMRHTENGEDLIAEYYDIAPGIVNCIEKQANKAVIYEEIYQTILQCVSHIKQKDYPEALRLYKEMTLGLKEKYR